MANEKCEMKSSEKNRLPSQPDANLRNVSSIVIQNGKDLEVSKAEVLKDKNDDVIEKEIEKAANEVSDKVTSETPTNTKTNVASFPCRLAKPKKDDKNKEMMEMFRKVELKIPLLDAIKQVPKYAKFLKDLYANKKRLRRDECIIVGESVSAVLQCKLPPKCGDPGMFSVPCKEIGKLEIKRAMLDLGAPINVIPKSIYKSLNIGPLKETGIIIQLADRTNAYPKGMIEDVLVQVNELIFPVDFYVLDMHDDNSPNPAPILLGRPFMCTAQTKIDVKQGILSMEFDGEKVQFNISDSIKYLEKSNALRSVNVIDKSIPELLRLNAKSILDIKSQPHPNQLKHVHLNDDMNLTEKFIMSNHRFKHGSKRQKLKWVRRSEVVLPNG
ncbi:uncharacterized protein LOC127258783 [Andrographis paniculata]|uniref:uncharacterized protein LOC127258783 n=1 Tax=Andrographis paniculata TaxID=175694 RepID=UPI0021E8BF4E|nr:uncharacterized protein LOC127258783 [Andrographis paniculata]